MLATQRRESCHRNYVLRSSCHKPIITTQTPDETDNDKRFHLSTYAHCNFPPSPLYRSTGTRQKVVAEQKNKTV